MARVLDAILLEPRGAPDPPRHRGDDAAGGVTDFLNAAHHAPPGTARRRGPCGWYERDGQAWLRAAGTWDGLPISLEQAYRMVGRSARQAFWGDRRAEASMLHHIAMRAAAR